MGSATIEFPGGQHAKAGKKLRLKVTYTGNPPAPDDIHVLAQATGQSGWPITLASMDIPAGAAPAAGIDLDVPVGTSPGAYDVKVEWTWKDPPRREEGRIGQYFVDESTERPGDQGQDLPKLDLWELFKTIGLPVTIVLSLPGLVGYGLSWLFGKPLAPWRRYLNSIWDHGFPGWFKCLLKKVF